MSNLDDQMRAKRAHLRKAFKFMLIGGLPVIFFVLLPTIVRMFSEQRPDVANQAEEVKQRAFYRLYPDQTLDLNIAYKDNVILNVKTRASAHLYAHAEMVKNVRTQNRFGCSDFKRNIMQVPYEQYLGDGDQFSLIGTRRYHISTLVLDSIVAGEITEPTTLDMEIYTIRRRKNIQIATGYDDFNKGTEIFFRPSKPGEYKEFLNPVIGHFLDTGIEIEENSFLELRKDLPRPWAEMFIRKDGEYQKIMERESLWVNMITLDKLYPLPAGRLFFKLNEPIRYRKDTRTYYRKYNFDLRLYEVDKV